MFFKKFFKKLFLIPSNKKVKNMSQKERQNFLYKQLYKYMLVKKILMNKLYLLHLSKEKNIPLMFENNIDEENIKKELMSLLDEGYEALSRIYLGESQLKAINELTKEEAVNVIQWIEQFFIEGFERIEEYEKCSLLKEFAELIKEVKQLN